MIPSCDIVCYVFFLTINVEQIIKIKSIYIIHCNTLALSKFRKQFSLLTCELQKPYKIYGKIGE